MFEGLGSGAYRFRYLIVTAWIAAAVLAYAFAPSLASQGTADQAAFLPSSASSAIADRALAKAFPGSTATSSATITFTRDDGLTDADRGYIDGFGSWSQSAEAPQALRDVVTSADTARTRPELESMLTSENGQLELLNVNLSIASAGDEAAVVVAALRDHAASTAPVGLAVHVTGTAGITTDYLDAIKSGTDSTTKVTVLLVLLILLLIYRAPLAALVPLVTIGAAFLVARGALGVLAAAGWHVSSLLDTFVVVLVFGVGTDYTIFLISRYREEVSAGDWHDASRRTVRRIGAVITASAATVIVGLGAMAFASFEMIRSTGPALGVAIAVTLVAGLTLAPALLGIFGHYLFWPQHARTGNGGEPGGFFARLADGVTRHPGSVTIALIVALLVPAAFVPQVKTNFDTLAELPPLSDARLGYEEVASHLGRGKLVQSTGLIDAGPRGDILAPATLALLRDTLASASGTPGVGSVTSLVTPKGDGVVPDGFQPSIQLTTMADSFASDSPSSADSASSASSLLDPELSTGLSSALDYVHALGLAFPDIAGRSEFRAATSAIANAQDIVERVRLRSIVSTQLRTIAAALLSPAAIAGGSDGASSDTALIGDYLAELAAAYPHAGALPAFTTATAAAASLERKPTAAAALDAVSALNALAVHFDATPTATLAAKSLANTPSALEAKREATAAFDAIPGALRGLAGAYAGRSDDIFIPVGLGGTEAASLEDTVDAFVTADRTSTRFYVTATDDPYAAASFAMVRTVQADLSAAAPAFGVSATASLGGSTAQLADVQTVLASDFERVGIITVLGILLVLALLLRAIVAPLYLVATVLLSYASAVGLAAWIFQGPLAQPGVSFYLPLLVFVLLVALGSDYNIFLMSRVREESETRPIRDGIRVASGRTGAVITSAGLILAGTFGSMATAQLAVLFQIGVAVAIGVLIDTFLVRSILVPAITMLVGDRAWWPTGFRLGAGRWLPPSAGVPAGGAPAGSAAASALSATAERRPHPSLGAPAAVVFLVLLPATLAGLLLWAGSNAGAAPVGAAIVNGDEGAITMAGDGSTEPLRFGADLAASLVGQRTSGLLSWTATDPDSAADGLRDGTFDAVLTIPAGYSRAVAAVRTDRSGAAPGPTLHLQTSDASGVAAQRVARDIAAAVSTVSTQHATESYVEDLLLAVSTTGEQLSLAVPSARDVATRTEVLASDATGIATISDELVSGLGVLALGTAQAVDGSARLANAMRALADGTGRLATGAGSLASGATDAASGATQLAAGASLLADGLAALDGQTSALPAQASALSAGAATLASGATTAAAGAASLAFGLETLETQTTGLGSNVAALDSAAGAVASGAGDLAAGAAGTASGAADLATGASQLETAIDAYAASVDALAAGCMAMGGGGAVCSALAGISASSTALTSAADGVASGADQLADATDAVGGGAVDLVAGAALLHAGTSELAASAPQLEAAIAQSAAGASALATGTAQVATGAAGLADGVDQLAGGMPALAGGVSQLSSAAFDVADGASTLATGASRVASGAETVVSGIRQTAAGAAELATGVETSAAGASQLASALGQAVDGAKVEQAQIGQLVRDGSTLAEDAGAAATALDAAASSTWSHMRGAEAQLAARAANPVSVETGQFEVSFLGPTLDGVPAIGVALIAVAAWLLGALFVTLVAAPRRGEPADSSTPSWRSPAAPRPSVM